MLSFVARRLVATLLVLLVASYVVYVLTAISGDPLEELRQSRDQNAQFLIADLTQKLQLDVPPTLRYFTWLPGAAGCLIGQCDLGISVARGELPVTEVIATAMGSTLQLITVATVLSILFGVAIGMTTALRQYSGYDYTVTFATFVFYSLPVFWVAVILKQYGGIAFNQFLGDPVIPWWFIVIFALVVGFVFMAIVGGSLSTRIKTFVFTGIAGGVFLAILTVTNWFEQPSIGLVGVIVFAIGNALIVASLTTGLKERTALIAFGLAAVVGPVALYYPLQYLFFFGNAWWTILIAAAALVAIGVIVGLLFGGDRKAHMARNVGLAAGLGIIPLVFDQMFQRWATYESIIPLSSGVISTIGASTPAIDRTDDYWLQMLDSLTHLILPTLTLMLISLAAYTRYSRASLLEVMNQDYVRTARAKGLSERVVVMRHAFRNAMIPIATIIAFDFGGLIGGAVITESVFAWKGMGAVFSDALDGTDVNLMMGFFLVTGVLAVLFNIIADLLYSALDPRIRVS
ncbi:ABC transporter permease [Microbacterium xanthum]|uniref:ABC transporter permease n=1 Tax=Microbacterium xanthum TaxID=3079794 RepID=UPI002AD42E81|nr:ABC transporter permease [Microbacterium sp. KSW-48]MDZ8172129.1 ABC transporter permease [Microbacterium sp. KSW-48]